MKTWDMAGLGDGDSCDRDHKNGGLVIQMSIEN